MIVVMKPGSTAQQLEHVQKLVREMGLKDHVIVGTERTVVACVGSDRFKDRSALETVEGVEKVVRRDLDEPMLAGELRTRGPHLSTEVTGQHGYDDVGARQRHPPQRGEAVVRHPSMSGPLIHLRNAECGYCAAAEHIDRVDRLTRRDPAEAPPCAGAEVPGALRHHSDVGAKHMTRSEQTGVHGHRFDITAKRLHITGSGSQHEHWSANYELPAANSNSSETCVTVT